MIRFDWVRILEWRGGERGKGKEERKEGERRRRKEKFGSLEPIKERRFTCWVKLKSSAESHRQRDKSLTSRYAEQEERSGKSILTKLSEPT